MKPSTLPVVALMLAAAPPGCAWTFNIALYRLWSLVPADVFPAYQAAHEVHFVPMAAVLGIPNLIVAILLARRGLPYGTTMAPLGRSILGPRALGRDARLLHPTPESPSSRWIDTGACRTACHR